MSSSSSAASWGRARGRVLRGVAVERALAPLEADLARPAPGAPMGSAPTAAVEAELKRGYDDGFEAGLAGGRAAAAAAATAEADAGRVRLEAAWRALLGAADDLRRRQALDLAGLEDTLTRAAFDLASAVVGRELALSTSPGADAVARALALVPAGSVAVARLHPDDAARLDGTGPDGTGTDRPGLPAGVSVIPDPAVEPGGCVLEVGQSRIDAQLGPALDRVRAALLGDRPSNPSPPVAVAVVDPGGGNAAGSLGSAA